MELFPWVRSIPKPARSPAVLVVPLALLGCQVGSAPETRRDPVTEVLHDVEIVDDYRWLEEGDSEEVRAWIDEQNRHAAAVLEEAADLRASFRERLHQLMDVPAIGKPMKAGSQAAGSQAAGSTGSEIFTLRRRGEPVARIVRRAAPPEDAPHEPIDPNLDYEVLVDPLSLRSDGTTSVEPQAVSPDGRLLLYSVRDGGPDEVALRLMDLESAADLPDRFPEALYGSSFQFATDSTGLLYVSRSRADGPRVRYHRFGSPTEDDVVVFGEGIGPTQFLQIGRSPDDRLLLFTVQYGWRSNDVHLQPVATDGVTLDGPPRALVVGVDARFEPRFLGEHLVMLTNLDAPRNRVVVVDPENPETGAWRELIPQSADTLLSFGELHGQLFGRYARDVSVRIRFFGPLEDALKQPLVAGVGVEAELPDMTSAAIEAAEEGKARLTTESFLEPPRTWTLDLESGEREMWQDSTVPFDGSAFEARRVTGTSKDGTRVPVAVVHRRGLAGGAHPTLLYGYGGFNAALLPGFDEAAAAWLEAGGVYAVATLRGGGEFGEAWHRGGMLENKQNVFDDFIAGAEALIEQGLTTPDHLAIRGTSNGGLLVASVMTQRPELMRAVYCGFPDLDMVRFFRFEETNNKPALLEYGDASDPSQFAFLREYSPYQAVRDGVLYPAVLLTTGHRDTRVPSLQARKMTARLQAATDSGRPVLLRHSERAGHAGGRAMATTIDDSAAELAFLWWQLGGGPVFENPESQ